MPLSPSIGRLADPQRLRNAQLLRSSKRYARERRWLSWFHLWSTLALLVLLLGLACPDSLPWLVRVPASLLAGLVLVRMFIVYHDFQHGSILKRSRLAKAVMTLYGLLTLNPPSIWNRSHNHHHKHNAKIFGASIGSYPIMTVRAYARAPRSRRLAYAISRHPLTIAAGYLTVFFYGMCIRSLLADPRAHRDSAVALLLHVAIIVAVGLHDGDNLLLAVLVPFAIAAAAGAYLFYIQHNYPAVKLHDRAAWDYVAAALESSSFTRMSPLMHWFTGNIGYHHVHHLNARIPFYRLPEAMAGLAALQSPGSTSLSTTDIRRCFALKLWDPEQGRLVGFDVARQVTGA